MTIKKFTDPNIVTKDDIDSLIMDIIEDGFIDIKVEYKFAVSDSIKSMQFLQEIPYIETDVYVCSIFIGAKLLRKDSAIVTNLRKYTDMEFLSGYLNSFLRLVNRIHGLKYHVITHEVIGSSHKIIIKLSDGIPPGFFYDMNNSIVTTVESELPAGSNRRFKTLLSYLENNLQLRLEIEHEILVLYIPADIFSSTIEEVKTKYNVEVPLMIYPFTGFSKTTPISGIVATMILDIYDNSSDQCKKWKNSGLKTFNVSLLKPNNILRIVVSPSFKIKK